MEEYHKIICPHCKHEFVNKDRSNLFSIRMDLKHIKCPQCHYVMSSMEIKRTKPLSFWDLITEMFNS